MFCSLMSVFLYFSGFESFAPLERWCDFAKFWCGKKKLVQNFFRGGGGHHEDTMEIKNSTDMSSQYIH